MLQLTPANVGTAPGTTTLTIPRAQMRPTPRSLEGALGTVYPTDFDLSKMYGYLPYNTGWISGRLINGKPIPPGFVELRGAETPTDPAAVALAITKMSPEQQAAALQVMETQIKALEVASREEELRTQKSNRFWNIITGLVAIGGLTVSIIALKRS